MTLVLFGACSDPISVPKPLEVKVRQISFGSNAAVEISWKLVLRVDSYKVFYDDDQPGEPYDGKGLSLVKWEAGCGDFDGGSFPELADSSRPAMDGGAVIEAGGPDSSGTSTPPQGEVWAGMETDSPITIPGEWCLELVDSGDDTGASHALTPAARPRVRIQQLVAEKEYSFAVQAIRNASESDLSDPITIEVSREQR